MRESSYDICVIGAGPAGCVTARQLVNIGYNVVLLEAKSFPRSHVGICFSDESYSLLDYIGVKEEVAKCAFHKRKTTLVKWQSDKPFLVHQPGFHVDRGRFDQILLQNAMSAGVNVIQPARAKNLLRSGAGWKVSYELAGKHTELFARFVVDASGYTNILPGRKIRMAPPLFAMHTIWSLKSTPDYDGFIEAAKDSWLWLALLNEKEAMITLFTEPKHFLKSENDKFQAHYIQMLQQFYLLRSCELDFVKGKVGGCDAGSRFSSDPVGENFIRVGDANIKIDPLASQGVHLAMSSALQAAVVVNTILKKPENNSYAIDFYRSRQQERVNQFRVKTASVYGQVCKYMPGPFWLERSGDFIDQTQVPGLKTNLPEGSTPVKLSAQTTIRSIPIMNEDFITMSPAVHHPFLHRPIAYLGGQDIVSLLLEVGKGKLVSDLINIWTPRISQNMAFEIFSWLWTKGILVTSEN